MHTLPLISESAMVLYGFATILQATCFFYKKWTLPIEVGVGCAWIGNLLHLLALYFLIEGSGEGQNLSLPNMFTLVAWIQTLFLLISLIQLPVLGLILFILPISAFSLWLAVHFPQPTLLYTQEPGIEIGHILLSVAAFGLLGIAAFQAFLIATQEFLLRKTPLGTLTALLPPLEIMERTLFLFIVMGFIILSLVLGSGFLFLHTGFWYTSSFKLIMSLASWLFFGVLLLGRYRYGWRGKTLVRWTFFGFIWMVSAYLGKYAFLE
ncbi:MAG: cytochrome c biogenesis protein CcsA [Gammaproteobacteria bacterium]|nr:cytochrome c biogenesis protein CcsA [Gammaproteobacteria bacterium]